MIDKTLEFGNVFIGLGLESIAAALAAAATTIGKGIAGAGYAIGNVAGALTGGAAASAADIATTIATVGSVGSTGVGVAQNIQQSNMMNAAVNQAALQNNMSMQTVQMQTKQQQIQGEMASQKNLNDMALQDQNLQQQQINHEQEMMLRDINNNAARPKGTNATVAAGASNQSLLQGNGQTLLTGGQGIAQTSVPLSKTTLLGS